LWRSLLRSPRTELLIAIKDLGICERLQRETPPQLLDNPIARRMLRDTDVQDASTIMTDVEEAVEHAEGHSWHREEIHGGNRFPMVAKEGSRRRDLLVSPGGFYSRFRTLAALSGGWPSLCTGRR
jgi:hypothetical protein